MAGEKKDIVKWWVYPLWGIGALVFVLFVIAAMVGSVYLLVPGLFLGEIQESAQLDAEKVVDGLELVMSEDDFAPISDQFELIESNCSKPIDEWQECMTTHRELNRMVHDYYEQHSSELDAFDPYLKDDIADLDKSMAGLEAEYARFRGSR